jgi:hypothetical protein
VHSTEGKDTAAAVLTAIYTLVVQGKLDEDEEGIFWTLQSMFVETLMGYTGPREKA